MNHLAIARRSFSLFYIPLISIYLLFPCSKTAAQLPVAADSLFRYIKEQSAYTKTTDWTSIDSLFSVKLALSKSDEDSLGCLVDVFKSLGDATSQIRYKGKKYQFIPSPDKLDQQARADLLKQGLKSSNPVYRTLFMQRFGYIRIQGMDIHNKNEANHMAQMIYDSIIHFSPENTKGLIVDLRLMNAGSTHALLAGLSPLLGDGIILKELNSEGRTDKSWKIKNSNLYIDSLAVMELKLQNLKGLETKPVVVLIGPATSGPGSYAGIAFRRRPNTQTMGEPTAPGYSTISKTTTFGKDLEMDLATHFIADRFSTIYPESLAPDLFVHRGDQFERLLSDKKIKEALYWLMKQ